METPTLWQSEIDSIAIIILMFVHDHQVREVMDPIIEDSFHNCPSLPTFWSLNLHLFLYKFFRINQRNNLNLKPHDVEEAIKINKVLNLDLQKTHINQRIFDLDDSIQIKVNSYH